MTGYCIIIPSFNNRSTIESVVSQLVVFELPILIVNDGSSAEYKEQLKKLANRYAKVTCIHRSQNGGKGAAVVDGITFAHGKGYTHAIQIDGDNQHQAQDIPLFLNASAKHPKALILGTPKFDADVPLGRLIGRQVSRFFVCLETLSLAIDDPLFGFRLYPIAPTHKLISSTNLGLRMDFDPEIAVRLCWQGLKIINIKTPVRYPESGTSHFHYLNDNLRISWMHTRLCLGMMIRLPRLVGYWFTR